MIRLISSNRLETYNQAEPPRWKELAWLLLGYGFLAVTVVIVIMEAIK